MLTAQAILCPWSLLRAENPSELDHGWPGLAHRSALSGPYRRYVAFCHWAVTGRHGGCDSRHDSPDRASRISSKPSRSGWPITDRTYCTPTLSVSSLARGAAASHRGVMCSRLSTAVLQWQSFHLSNRALQFVSARPVTRSDRVTLASRIRWPPLIRPRRAVILTAAAAVFSTPRRAVPSGPGSVTCQPRGVGETLPPSGTAHHCPGDPHTAC